MQEYTKGLGKDLLDLRTRLGIGQELMARCLGIATSTLRRAEKQKADLSPRLRVQVMRRLSQLPQEFPEIVSDEVKREFWADSIEYEAVKVERPGSLLSRLLGMKTVETQFKVKTGREKFYDSARLKFEQSDRLRAILSKGEPDTGDDPNKLTICGKITRDLVAEFCDELEASESTASELLERILTFYFECKRFLLE